MSKSKVRKSFGNRDVSLEFCPNYIKKFIRVSFDLLNVIFLQAATENFPNFQHLETLGLLASVGKSTQKE